MAWAGVFDDFAGSSSFVGHGGSTNNTNSVSTSGRTSISDLVPGMPNGNIVGVIISKSEPKAFPSKKNPGTDIHLMNFTLRDSPTSFINGTCFGNEEFISTLGQSFHLGDVVEVSKYQVQSKPTDGSDEKFRPWTPSSYQLTINEHSSSVHIYEGWDVDEYSALTNLPVKAGNDFCTLGDILVNGQGLHGEHVNLLAVVKSVGQVRNITTKTGRQIKRCEVKLFDETSPSFPLVIWDEETVKLAQDWIPKECVLFAADVKVTFDNYKKGMIATADSKTIFTINPDTSEAHRLYQYAQTVDLDTDAEDNNQSTKIDISTIHDVYNVEQIQDRQCIKDDETPTYGITHAFISTIDLDGSFDHVIAVRCVKCHFKVDSYTEQCCNPDCPAGSGVSMETGTDTQYNIIISVSDHTGTLNNCRLNQDVAEQIVGCKAEEFSSLSEHEKTNIKWRFLLEKWRLYFKSTPVSFNRTTPSTRIVACKDINFQEAVRVLQ